MKGGWYIGVKDGKSFNCYWHITRAYFTIETANPEDSGRYALHYFDEVKEFPYGMTPIKAEWLS